ncbi:MAG: carbamoyltransferase C-terminal domain-containing protein [Gemmatimonadota bacterium]
MIILGISMNVGASAALMIDGKIVAATMEERFNRRKNFDGYPARAVEYCLAVSGVRPADVDVVAWPDVDSADPDYFLTHRYSEFSVSDFIREQEAYWYPRFYRDETPDFLQLFPDRIDVDQFPGRDHLARIAALPDAAARYQALDALRDAFIEMHVGIPSDKVVRLNHHRCHAAYAACAQATGDEPRLVFTVDGSGDGENATVSRWDGSRLHKLTGTDRFVLGRYYRHATLILGMRMAEHEFKVMGLAPYAKPYHSDAPFHVYRDALSMRDGELVSRDKPRDSYFHFKERLKACRFDGIAGGLQRFAEELLSDWIGSWMAHTGIRHVAVSGGVSMNVKANLSMLERCQPTSLVVPGSGTDDSLAIGACYLSALERNQPVFPLESMYLGDDIATADVERGLATLDRGRFDIQERVGPDAVAQQLASGKVIGRCVGRMEFGARALGNRSLLADPRNPDVVRVINDKIKGRDFWMPFAPTLLDRAAGEYVQLHAGTNYSAMTVAAPSTAMGRASIRAALHPADETARPQILRREVNPGYYDVIDRFSALTGVHGLLNTSLNLHGSPIVRTVSDALEVLTSSDIDGVVLGESLVMRKDHATST